MNDELLLRYSKHILLPQIDYEGQEKITKASVAIVGLGGLGGQVAELLTTAGVAEIHLIDDQKVTLDALMRSPIHAEKYLDEPSVVSAKLRLEEMNKQVEIIAHCNALSDETLFPYLQNVSLILDCTDTFELRFQLNDLAFGLRKPLISGACVGFEGQVMVFDYREGKGPCYRCIHEVGEQIRTPCTDQGIFATLPSVIGSLQATEALKCLVNAPLASLIRYDGYRNFFQHFTFTRDPFCNHCSEISI